MGPAPKPDQKRRLGFLTGLRLCEAIEREFPELSRWKVIRILAIVLDEMQRTADEKRPVMKKFEQLDAHDQILLMTGLIKKIADSGYLDRCHGSVAEWARAAGSMHLISGATSVPTPALTNVYPGPDIPWGRKISLLHALITIHYPIRSQSYSSRSGSLGRIELRSNLGRQPSS